MKRLLLAVGMFLSINSLVWSENLISNSGFEFGEEKEIKGWNFPKSEAVRIERDSVVKAEGKYSLRLSLAEGTTPERLEELKGTSPWFWGVNATSEFYVKGNRFYRLTGWAKTTNLIPSTHTKIQLSFKKDDGSWIKGGKGYWLSTEENKDWTRIETIFKTPAEATRGYITLWLVVNRIEKDKLPVVWYDDLSLEEFIPPFPTGKSWVYPAYQKGQGGDITDDKDSPLGKVWKIRLGIDKPGAKISGAVITDQPPGIYEVTYRLKVADNSTEDFVAFLHTKVSDGIFDVWQIGSLDIKGTDFKEPNKYQDFTFYFLYGTGTSLQYLCTWYGYTDLWIDTITVKQLKAFTDEDILDYITIPLEKKK